MTGQNLSWARRLLNSLKGHLRVALIAVIFGMTAYGFIYMLYLVIAYVEKL